MTARRSKPAKRPSKPMPKGRKPLARSKARADLDPAICARRRRDQKNYRFRKKVGEVKPHVLVTAERMEALIRRATHWYVKQGKNGKEARALAERESLRRDWIIKEIEDVLERMIDDFKEARYQ